MYSVVFVCQSFFWCPCMAINQCSKCTVQRWASPRHYTVDPMLLPSGNPFKCHEDILFLQTMIPPKLFNIPPPVWDAQKIFLRPTLMHTKNLYENGPNPFFFFWDQKHERRPSYAYGFGLLFFRQTRTSLPMRVRYSNAIAEWKWPPIFQNKRDAVVCRLPKLHVSKLAPLFH